ncbi:hypothetical protein MYMA111404_00045 [Mycoplasma marinum]|uniref:Uncharacterized protein n=1 Tax=Mycoplasma marinum TaxID=1937190 RepID=A0A4R0XQ47_9MOLU|nr:hypothetical protein [Mycoplasma marinum]TCG11695.1 hypothetical protein C4B24_00890 [Mycoplasma marinum]
MNKKDIEESILKNQIAIEYTAKQKLLKIKEIENINLSISNNKMMINSIETILGNNFPRIQKNRNKGDMYFILPVFSGGKVIFPNSLIKQLEDKVKKKDFVNIISFNTTTENNDVEYKSIIQFLKSRKIKYSFLRFENTTDFADERSIIFYMINNSFNLSIVLCKEGLKKINFLKDNMFFVNSMFIGQEKAFLIINKSLQVEMEKNDFKKANNKIFLDNEKSNNKIGLMSEFDFFLRILVYKIQNIFIDTLKNFLLKDLLKIEEKEKKQELILFKNKIKLRNMKYQLEAEEKAIINNEDGKIWE